MSYQNVSTPRFYVSILQWLKAIGQLEDLDSNPQHISESSLKMVDINPTSQAIFGPGPNDGYNINFKSKIGTFDTLMPNNKNFFMVLGHTFGSNDIRFRTKKWSNTGIDDVDLVASNGIVNYGNTQGYRADFNGFSIAIGNDAHDNTHETLQMNLYYYSADVYYKFGAILYGTYYEMPVAPDLSLSMEHDYSGIKKTTSMSGASFTNANWVKPPKWGDKEAWQLGDFPRPYSGRRIWDLSFSYVSDEDLEPRNYTGTLQDIQHQQGDDNWFENVLHYTMGGHLPFIFQPNKDATYNWTDGDHPYINEIPEFAICRFDMNSFSREQVAPGVYNIKIKVKESW